MTSRNTQLVEGFRHTAPYVNAHQGKIMVIALGGEAIEQANFRHIVNDIALIINLGIQVILVYGARPQINRILKQQGLTEQYHKHIRITDEVTLEAVKQAAGQLQLDLTARFSMGLTNTPMAGSRIQVVSGNFITAQPLGIDDGVDYCHSGQIRRVHQQAIEEQLNQGRLVLIGPIASSITGECFNLISEDIATRIAVQLKAHKLIGYCAKNGIMEENNTLSELLTCQAQRHLQQEIENDPHSDTARFLRAAITACQGGVPRSHLLNYQTDGALLQELFTTDGIGTQILMASSEKIRTATTDDIPNLLALIRPLEEDGILVRRSREQLEWEISQFTVIERENRIIGCIALYSYTEEQAAEMACMAVHPDYRDADRGLQLFQHLCQQAKQQGIKNLFALTTRSLHWFLEQGFTEVTLDALPMAKKTLYNLQRRSKILMKTL